MHQILAFPLVLALVNLAAAQAAELANGQEQEVAPQPATPTGQIACNRGGQILLIDAATGAESVLVADNTYDRPLYWLPAGDRLIYWNHDGGAWDLWAIDPDTKAAQNLTGTARDNRSACASADGTKIAFHRGGDGVWLMDADGKSQRQVHKLGHRDNAPVWSPSGGRLAFSDLEQAGEGRIRMVVHAVLFAAGKPDAGTNLGRGETAFFLDERQLVVTATHDGRPELVIVDVTTGERRALTDSAARDDRAALSPDGQEIVWIEDGTEGASDRLMIMRRDGSEQRELAPVAHYFAPPTFSPDGRFVTFESGKERRKTEVYVVSTQAPTKGSVVLPMTTKGGNFPVWRPAAQSKQRPVKK